MLAGIITAYFTVPVSYAGTSEREAVYSEVSEFKLLLPVEAQARQVMEGNMNDKQILDTLDCRKDSMCFGGERSATSMTEFHLRSGHRLWLISGSDSAKLGEIAHSDFPFRPMRITGKAKGWNKMRIKKITAYIAAVMLAVLFAGAFAGCTGETVKQHMNLLMEPAIFLVLVIIKASNLKSLQLYALTTKRKKTVSILGQSLTGMYRESQVQNGTNGIIDKYVDLTDVVENGHMGNRFWVTYPEGKVCGADFDEAVKISENGEQTADAARAFLSDYVDMERFKFDNSEDYDDGSITYNFRLKSQPAYSDSTEMCWVKLDPQGNVKEFYYAPYNTDWMKK